MKETKNWSVFALFIKTLHIKQILLNTALIKSPYLAYSLVLSRLVSLQINNEKVNLYKHHANLLQKPPENYGFNSLGFRFRIDPALVNLVKYSNYRP